MPHKSGKMIVKCQGAVPVIIHTILHPAPSPCPESLWEKTKNKKLFVLPSLGGMLTA